MSENIVSVELIAICEMSVLKAESRIVGCQSCSRSVSRPFSSILTEVVGAGSAAAEYILCTPGRCPNCTQRIFENTLVRCEDDIDDDPYPGLDFGRCWDDR